jgi:hypothetical protein
MTYTRDGKPPSPKLIKQVNLMDTDPRFGDSKRENPNNQKADRENRKSLKDNAESSPFQQEVEKLQGRLGYVDARLRWARF